MKHSKSVNHTRNSSPVSRRVFLGFAALVALVGLAASLQAQSATALDHRNPRVQEVMAIQDSVTPDLMKLEDVLGTATGLNAQDQVAVVVFVNQRGRKMAELMKALPKDIRGAPVVVELTDEFRALKGKPGPTIDPTSRFQWPVPIGVSTGHPAITAGTIGCRVKDAAGNRYALSNNHVYADENAATVGDLVLQPGPYDGGTWPGDAIGSLFSFKPIQFNGGANYIDAAIALSDTGSLGNATPANGYGTPGSTPVSAKLRMSVKKYGRTTGLTTGRVIAINATFNIGYSSGTALFVNQIAISPGSFSAGGDSGSLIVTADTACSPVGLLFAGNSSYTIASPIQPVLGEFGVTMDGK